MAKKTKKEVVDKKPTETKTIEGVKPPMENKNPEDVKPEEQKKDSTVKAENPKNPEDVKKTGLSFEEAEVFLNIGELVKLPEWGGFWFKNLKTDKIYVYTKDDVIVDTPFDKYKERNDWEAFTSIDPDKYLKLSEFQKLLNKNSFLNEVLDALSNGKKIGIKGSKQHFKEVDGKVNKYSADGDYLGVYSFEQMKDVEGLFIVK
jgi:hypothetical protein